MDETFALDMRCVERIRPTLFDISDLIIWLLLGPHGVQKVRKPSLF